MPVRFDRARKRFQLTSLHPGHSVEEAIEHTGFDFDQPEQVPVTAAPDAETLRLMRDRRRAEVAEVYPQFAAHVLESIQAASDPSTGEKLWKHLEVAVIGTGWCGGIIRNPVSLGAGEEAACLRNPPRPAQGNPTLTRRGDRNPRLSGHRQNPDIAVVLYLDLAGPTHYPMRATACAPASTFFSEKPIALALFEADELIAIAKRNRLKFTIGYSQRFNTKYAYAKKKIMDGTLGRPVSAVVSRHLSRSLGKKIASRVKLSPAAMEATHDLDFVFWLLEPAKPVRVYSQGAYGVMQPVSGSYDTMWTTVTMDSGVLVVIGAGWNLPPGYPNFSSTWVEITGAEGALILDDTHRNVSAEYRRQGHRVSDVDHAGRTGRITSTPARWGRRQSIFSSPIMLDRPVMVTPESARVVMEVYTAADLSAERNEPVDIPLSNEARAAVAAAQ